MNFKNDGLTVGELTITIGILFLVFITWSAIGKRKNPNQTQLAPSQPEILLTNEVHKILAVSYIPMDSTSRQP